MADLLPFASPGPSCKVPYPHQERALAQLQQSVAAGHRRPVLMLPTGAGKTFVAAMIVKRALAKGKRVFFVVPSIALVNQTVEAFQADGIARLGVIQAWHPLTDYSAALQIASVQTLARRPRFHTDLVIVDEAHLGSEVIRKWMRDEPDLIFIGLSATPWRKGMAEEYDDLIIGATVSELIGKGLLSDFRAFAPSHPDLTGIKTKAGDYETEALSVVMRKQPLVADIVRTWLEKGEARSTFCFCVDRAHAMAVKTSFDRAGISCGYVDGTTDAVEREVLRSHFQDGTIKVICNVGVLTTGIDWDVRCLILARPTKSEMLYVQMVGRGLRTAIGKTDCLILDHSDNTQRLGFVTDVAHDELLVGKSKAKSQAKKDEPLPTPCPKCSFLKQPRCAECPSCGFKPERQSTIATAEGQLVQVRGNRAQAPRSERQSWLSQLHWIAQERGYKSGWVNRTYEEKFSCKPNGLHRRPAPPTDEVRNYVTSRIIAFSKKGKAHGS